MPAGAVGIKAEFIESQSNISVLGEDGGAAWADRSNAAVGTVVEIEAMPYGDNAFEEWVVIKGGDNLIADKTANPTTFIMPDGEVEIRATFYGVMRSIDFNIVGNGIANASTVRGVIMTEALAGTVVKLNAIMGNAIDEGIKYAFKRWSVEGGEMDFFPNAKSDTVTFTMPAHDVTITAEFVEGFLYNGLIWALSNVDAPGTFAATPESSGMYYQWNHRTGWTVENGELVSSPAGEVWDGTRSTAAEWEPANDPCPEGWRMPTTDEQATLIAQPADTASYPVWPSTWTWPWAPSTAERKEWISRHQEGSVGWSKTEEFRPTPFAEPRIIGRRIFFPYAGSIEKALIGTDVISSVDDSGFYWSTSPAPEPAIASGLFVNKHKPNYPPGTLWEHVAVSPRTTAHTIRCVAKYD
jgi:hypothetical protein